MNIVDTFHVDSLGDLTFHFNEDGTLIVYSPLDQDTKFVIKIISLDTNLTCNILYNHTLIGFDRWCYYNWPITPLLKSFHPGFILEIYPADYSKLLFRKIYHNNKHFICCDLKSNIDEIMYCSYYSFFYDDKFSKYYNINKNDVVYDLGANIGSFSLSASNYFPKKIYAFEPWSKTFEYLKYNCEKYGRNIECFEKAIWKNFEMICFGGGHSVANKVDTTLDSEVHAINLEGFINYNNLEKPTYLKIDIEGAEYTFFNEKYTSDNFFSTINNIFLEFHQNDGNNLNKIIDRCNRLGYNLFLHNDDCTITDYNGFLLFKK